LYDDGEYGRKIQAKGYDEHAENAQAWFPDMSLEDGRRRAKVGGYALQYLCQPPTLAPACRQRLVCANPDILALIFPSDSTLLLCRKPPSLFFVSNNPALPVGLFKKEADLYSVSDINGVKQMLMDDFGWKPFFWNVKREKVGRKYVDVNTTPKFQNGGAASYPYHLNHFSM
jgi:hypothetical protein